jgi:ubiquinone/menaquinone biosynthesis C-methylase UbiE
MGGRVIGTIGRHSNGGANPKLPNPLVELIRLADSNEHVPVGRLADLVEAFAAEKRKHAEVLTEAERRIREAYTGFSGNERARFFAMLYDRFSERYDEHMEKTGHYAAIRRVLHFAMPHLKTPMLDITAGTGEVLLCALNYMRDARVLAGTSLAGMHSGPERPGAAGHIACANEISPKMFGAAQKKLSGMDVGFANSDAMAMPQALGEKFTTVICSQTFHIIPDEDKARLAVSMRGALRPGGIAIVMEEDPFRITQTPQIEPVSLFLRAVVSPIKPGMLAGMFEVKGFTRLEETACAPIDSEHSMRLHIFKK